MTEVASQQSVKISKHFPQLDGLRGIAILMVLVYHFVAISPLPVTTFEKMVFILAKSGWIGVDLFFVLSGFLISGILIAAKDKENYFVNFYVRRILRIFPLYYLVLLVFFVVVPLSVDKLAPQLQIMKENQIWFWTYLANWCVAINGDFNKTSGGYFWSLAVEEQFYIVWPFIVYIFSVTNFRKICVGLFIFCFCLRNLLLLNGVSTTSVYAATFTHMDGLLIGSWLSTVAIDPFFTEKIRPLLNRAALYAFAILVVIVIYQGTFFFWDTLVASFGYTLLSIIFASILFESVLNNTKLNILFNTVFFKDIGKYSYAMYLIHVPVSKGLKSLFFNSEYIIILPLILKWFVFVVVASVITYFISYISWNVFEKHFLKLKVHFESRVVN